MPIRGHLVQVIRPTHENAVAAGIVGTAYRAVPEVESLFILDPSDPGDLEVVGQLYFTEGELEQLL
ncbi:MAG: hypothetical protein H8E48_07215 [Chloroflexi bacterium]|nr:hypothetical protein [Chloroflexota bacterium]